MLPHCPALLSLFSVVVFTADYGQNIWWWWWWWWSDYYHCYTVVSMHPTISTVTAVALIVYPVRLCWPIGSQVVLGLVLKVAFFTIKVTFLTLHLRRIPYPLLRRPSHWPWPWISSASPWPVYRILDLKLSAISFNEWQILNFLLCHDIQHPLASYRCRQQLLVVRALLLGPKVKK